MLETEMLQGFSRSEVVITLNKVRNRFCRPPVSEPTFYRWLGELGITPKFRYSVKEVKRLQRLCLHYCQGGKTADYQDLED